MLRQRMDELKGMVKNTRCHSKLMDAIWECICNTAYENAEEFGATPTELRVALEELVYDYTSDEGFLEATLKEAEE